MFKRAFTMIELIFVIVVMGILGKFGTEFLMQAYENFFFSTLQNRLQQQSEAAVTQLAARLQYRIKGSVVQSAGGAQIDWVGMDIEGWRGTWNGTKNTPTWSGFINLETVPTPNTNLLRTPQTNISNAENIIQALSYDSSRAISDSAIIFIGATDPTSTIWDGGVTSQIDELAHPIQASGNNFASKTGIGDFSGVDIYEFYKLAWTAYTVRLANNNLTLYYDYQPWNNENWNSPNTHQALLMENVESFQYQTIGDLIKIQVCINDNNLTNPTNDVNGGFSVCKEKTIF